MSTSIISFLFVSSNEAVYYASSKLHSGLTYHLGIAITLLQVHKSYSLDTQKLNQEFSIQLSTYLLITHQLFDGS